MAERGLHIVTQAVEMAFKACRSAWPRYLSPLLLTSVLVNPHFLISLAGSNREMASDVSRWPPESELGVGTFSKVFSATDQVTSSPVVLKYPNTSEASPMLHKEAKTLASLQMAKCMVNIGVPKLVHVSKSPTFVVMQRVGKTLLELSQEIPRMTTKTVIMVGLKVVEGLEEIHTCGYLHRDVKPDNIAVAWDPADPTVYLIDFGLSCRYQRAGTHVIYTEEQEFSGTPYFASLNSVRGVRPSRRDDLESLGYVMLFFLQGSLPWFSIQSSKPSEVLSFVLKCREKHPLSVLCQGCDWEMRDYLAYCQSLSYAEKPNYVYLKRVLMAWAQRLGLNIDWIYDWTPANLYPSPPSSPSLFPLHSVPERKRKSLGPRNSPSINMSELLGQSGASSPGQMRESLRRFSLQVPNLCLSESSSTGENSPEMPKTPVRGFDQLPSLMSRPKIITPIAVPVEPKSGVLPSIEECEEKRAKMRVRRHTCHEVSLIEDSN